MSLECMFILSLCMPLVFAPVSEQPAEFERQTIAEESEDEVPTVGNLPEPPEEPYQCSDERFVNDLTECEYDEREEQQEREFDDCGPQRSEQFKQEIGCPGFEEEEDNGNEEQAEEEEPQDEDENIRRSQECYATADDPGSCLD